MKEETGEEEDGANGFDDWESLHYNHYRHSSPTLLPLSSSSPSSSSSSHSLALSQLTTTHHDNLSIFPPVNHEGLPISQSTPTLSNSRSISRPFSPSPPPSPSPSPTTLPRNSQLVSWFDFALHRWNSMLLSLLTRLRFPGFLVSLRPVAAAASILAILCFWARRRRRRSGGDERVEQLKLLVKEKDEKILQLLEQIAAMNKALLTRYRIPVLKST